MKDGHIFSIHVLGSPILRQKAEFLVGPGISIADIGVELKSICVALGAAGMAANQLGYKTRMCAVRLNDGTYTILFNPNIVEKSEEIKREREYCFSLPGFSALVDRSESVTIEWQDLDGNKQKGEFLGNEARYAQHEIDHLDGVLISDKMQMFGRNKLNEIKNKFKKQDFYYKVSELGELVR